MGTLTIRKQFAHSDGPWPRIEWTLWDGDKFICYCKTYTLAAQLVKEFSQKFRRKVLPDPSIPIKPLTAQEAIRVEANTKGESFDHALYGEIVRRQRQTG